MIGGVGRELALLSALAEGKGSQRALSARAGLSLGGTNELLRCLIRDGQVRAVALDRRSVRYELTARGREAGRLLALSAAGRAVEIARSL